MKPTMFRKILLLCLSTALPVVASAQYEGYSTSRLLVEMGEVMSQARAAETRVKASLARRDQFARELQEINRERDSYQRDNRRYQSDLDKHNDAVDAFNDSCKGGSYTEQELRQCEREENELKTAQAALNERRDELEEARLAVSARMAEYNSREKARAADAEAELAEYDAINATITSMMGQLQGKPEFAGSPCFTRSSPEAKHQCLLQAFNNRR